MQDVDAVHSVEYVHASEETLVTIFCDKPEEL